MSDIQLAGFFGEAGRTVYAEARRIRERYEPERYQQIMDATNPENGARLSYKHLALLLRVEDNAQADKMLEHCLQSGLSTREFGDFIAKKLKQPGASPRPLRHRPKNFVGLLEQMSSSADDFQGQFKEAWGSGKVLLDSFDAIPEEKRNEELAAKVKEAEKKLRQAAEDHKFLARELAGLGRNTEEAILRRRQGGKPPAVATVREDDDEDAEADEGNEKPDDVENEDGEGAEE
jgi:hypothetical protein